MSDVATDNSAQVGKSGKLPIIIGLILVLVGAGAGFVAVQKGVVDMILSTETHTEEQNMDAMPRMGDTSEIAFVEIDPIMISLVDGGDIQYLRFRAQLEVAEEYESDVRKLLPRVVDVLNGYLRALEIDDFRSPTALIRLRGQMLHRVQIVAGKNRVRDLLIMDFVLN